jgi:transcriptional regulator with XRE-family HTH domain
MPVHLHIAAWRKHRGFTQAQLAERVGLHPVSLSHIERRNAEPKAGALYALASALGTTCEGLLAEPKAETR